MRKKIMILINYINSKLSSHSTQIDFYLIKHCCICIRETRKMLQISGVYNEIIFQGYITRLYFISFNFVFFLV